MSFLYDTWYAAGWASDLADQLIGRKIVGIPILLFRNAQGKAVAIGDRCPHRFAPLHRGRKVDGAIECAYHGIRFGETGACVLIPGAEERTPANMRAPAYPIEERNGVLWIWPGRSPANRAAVLDLSDQLSNPKYCHVTGSLTVQANYELLADNLIDPSHGQFLHGALLKRDGFFEAPHEMLQDGTTISSERVIRNATAPAAYAPFLPDPEAPVDWWTRAQWDPPGIFRLDNGVVPVGKSRDEGVRRCGVHLITPETETSTHYFFAAVRNYRLGDPKTDEASRTWQQTVFEEQDRPMLEAVQQMMGTTDFAALHPVLISADQPSMRIRSTMRRLLLEEEHATARHVASR